MLELAKEEDWVIVSGDLRIRKTLTKSWPGDRLDTRSSS